MWSPYLALRYPHHHLSRNSSYEYGGEEDVEIHLTIDAMMPLFVIRSCRCSDYAYSILPSKRLGFSNTRYSQAYLIFYLDCSEQSIEPFYCFRITCVQSNSLQQRSKQRQNKENLIACARVYTRCTTQSVLRVTDGGFTESCSGKSSAS